MEFHIQRDTLLAGIRRTLGIVEKKTTIPILNNVLIKAKGNRITIIATDIEITLVANYEAEILSEGELTLSAKKLHEMMREIPEGVVHVKKGDGNLLTISCQKAVFRINSLSVEDFPSIAEDEDVPLTKIDREIMEELISKSIFAVSTDETRLNLTGALLEMDNEDDKNVLRMVATDGFRLAFVQYIMGNGDFIKLDKGVILPRKGLMEIRKLLEEGMDNVLVGFRQGMCLIQGKDMLLKVNLIDAEFPNYRRVIPQERGIVIKFEKEKVLHALRRINVISSEGYGGVIINLKHNRMVLNSNDPDVGEANDEIEIEYSGDEIAVGYNVEYLLNAIEVIGEKEVVFEIGEGKKSSVVKGDGNDRYMCIVMPLKL
jgi:DNA polymerase-3 subunit beta